MIKESVKAIVVVSGRDGQNLVEKLFEEDSKNQTEPAIKKFVNIMSVIIFTSNKSLERNKEWSKNYSVVESVVWT